jgi:hypothetical protein
MCSSDPYRTKAEVPQYPEEYPEEPIVVVSKTPMWKKILSPFVGAGMLLGIPAIIACILFYIGRGVECVFHLKNIPNSGSESYLAHIFVGIGIILFVIVVGFLVLKIVEIFKHLGDAVLGVK